MENLTEVKKAWADGVAVQFAINGLWFDWDDQDDISISKYKLWRIKPLDQEVKQ